MNTANVNTTTEPIRLDDASNTNWHLNASPVAVLNPDSSLHDRLAYCWGLASRLSEMTNFIGVHGDFELQRVSMLLVCHVSPLVTVLEALAESTDPRKG